MLEERSRPSTRPGVGPSRISMATVASPPHPPLHLELLDTPSGKQAGNRKSPVSLLLVSDAAPVLQLHSGDSVQHSAQSSDSQEFTDRL